MPRIDTDLIQAARNGDTEATKRLIDSGPNVHATDRFGKTPLHWAARKGHTEIAQALLRAGAKVDATDKYSWTPLHEAAMHGHTKTALALLQAGAKVHATDKFGKAPLHWAAYKGRTETALVLLQGGVNVNARTDAWQEETPLHRALCSFRRSKDCIKMLLSYLPNLYLKDKYNQCVLKAIKADPIGSEAYNEYLQDNLSSAAFLLSRIIEGSDSYCLPEEMALQVLTFSRPSYYKPPSSGLRGITHDLSTLQLTH